MRPWRMRCRRSSIRQPTQMSCWMAFLSLRQVRPQQLAKANVHAQLLIVLCLIFIWMSQQQDWQKSIGRFDMHVSKRASSVLR